MDSLLSEHCTFTHHTPTRPHTSYTSQLTHHFCICNNPHTHIHSHVPLCVSPCFYLPPLRWHDALMPPPPWKISIWNPVLKYSHSLSHTHTHYQTTLLQFSDCISWSFIATSATATRRFVGLHLILPQPHITTHLTLHTKSHHTLQTYTHTHTHPQISGR